MDLNLKREHGETIEDIEDEIIACIRNDMTDPDWYVNKMLVERNQMAKKTGKPMINVNDLFEEGYFRCDEYYNRMPYPI